MPQTPSISLTRTVIYDTDADYDTEVDRVDHIMHKEVLAYVPTNSPHRGAVLNALAVVAKDLNFRDLVDPAGNPPASP